MKADPEAQRRLLDLQALDTGLAQLAHKRRTLPENAEVERLGKEVQVLSDERASAQVAVDDLGRDIDRIERDVEQVRTRADRDKARLDAGTGPGKQLEALQHELETLARRQRDLEDAELELMEKKEEAETVLAEIDGRLTSSRAALGEVERRREDLLAGIAKDEEFRRSGRTPLVADLPADLITLYEQIRANTGMGAALLRAGRCEGCRLELSGSERTRIRAAAKDDVVRCDDCRRILVRTAESGL